MEQQYERYSQEDHEIWSILMKRIKGSLDKANKEYLKGLEIVNFSSDRVPTFDEVNSKLMPLTGWQYQPVEGSVSNYEFFEALSKKIFLSSIDIRSRDELEFCKLPDIFHDLFGHAPMLTDQSFCDFLEQLGLLSQGFPSEKNLKYLSRLYWYTAEVGLVMEDKNLCYYGGSIISSLKEIETVLSPDTEKLSYNLDNIIHTNYDSYTVNNQYYVVNDLSILNESLDGLKIYLEKQEVLAE
jgi:phenylalanine-4-hydroxylase